MADYGVWEIGVPTSGPGSAHGGTNCLATILSGNYTDDRESRVVSPAFQIPAAGLNPRLRFWHWWNFNAGDFGQVQISTNNGASWQALSGPVTSSSAGAWLYSPSVSLSSYADQTVRLGLYFESSGGGNVAPGWYLDDIRLIIDDRPPWIISWPADQTVTEGSLVWFGVSAVGAEPISYQWRFNGSPIAGETNSTYTIASAQLSNAGTNDVVVSNSFGYVFTTNHAVLT